MYYGQCLLSLTSIEGGTPCRNAVDLFFSLFTLSTNVSVYLELDNAVANVFLDL